MRFLLVRVNWREWTITIFLLWIAAPFIPVTALVSNYFGSIIYHLQLCTHRRTMQFETLPPFSAIRQPALPFSVLISEELFSHKNRDISNIEENRNWQERRRQIRSDTKSELEMWPKKEINNSTWNDGLSRNVIASNDGKIQWEANSRSTYIAGLLRTHNSPSCAKVLFLLSEVALFV